MKPTTTYINTKTNCAFCGQMCAADTVEQAGNTYCCFGCATIHNVVDMHIDLADIPVKYRQYDLPEVFNKAVEFVSDNQYRVRLNAPNIHCSSCVQLIEDLPVLDERILRSTVNFEERTIEISVKKTIALSELSYLLDRLGYPPQFDLDSTDKRKAKSTSRKQLNKLAVIGFCFGNSMLFSLPHYMGLELANDLFFGTLFNTLNFALSLVVLIYGAREYLSSAAKAISVGRSHINIPIAIGIIAIWVWSVYEVLTSTGFGYFDSLAGLIFFLLAGKWFQSRVYKKVTFERSLHDLLPLSVRVKEQNSFVWKNVNDLELGDTILIKNGEVIPVSGKITSGEAFIDYSFVTGEANPQTINKGEMVFIGGKQLLADITIKLLSKPDPETIWSAWKTPKKAEGHQHWTDTVSRYFTPAILSIAIISAVAWYFIDPSKSLFVFSSVLIVACPCALALSSPFTFGSIQRHFSRNGLYMKSTDVISRMAKINHMVFDKTGTLTDNGKTSISVIQNDLNPKEENATKCLAAQSNHVVGHWLCSSLRGNSDCVISDLKILAGQGVSAQVDGIYIRIGSAQLFNLTNKPKQTHAYVEIDGKIKACFTFGNAYKYHLGETLNELGETYKLSILSGDNDSETTNLESLYSKFYDLKFNNKPEDKKAFMETLNKNGNSAIMIGDGLNDQIALSASDIGLVVAENINGFYPNSDGVLMAENFNNLPKLMALGNYASRVLWISLAFSMLYNSIGISFAVTGLLNPLIAAILMPLSSITVVGLVTAMVSHKSKKIGLK